MLDEQECATLDASLREVGRRPAKTSGGSRVNERLALTQLKIGE
jgi:hypothetical protein